MSYIILCWTSLLAPVLTWRVVLLNAVLAWLTSVSKTDPVCLCLFIYVFTCKFINKNPCVMNWVQWIRLHKYPWNCQYVYLHDTIILTYLTALHNLPDVIMETMYLHYKCSCSTTALTPAYMCIHTIVTCLSYAHQSMHWAIPCT